MRINHVVEIDLPETVLVGPDSPGGKAFTLMMQIMDLFDSAGIEERDYIAWRMGKIANNLRYVAHKEQASSRLSRRRPAPVTNLDGSTQECHRLPYAA
jgi:hypothetical protein